MNEAEMESSMSSSTVLSASWLEQFAGTRAVFPNGMEPFASPTAPTFSAMEASTKPSLKSGSPELKVFQQFAASRAALPIGIVPFASSTGPTALAMEASPIPPLTSASPEPKVSPVSSENSKQFLCFQCGYMATSKGSLTQHIQYIHDTEKKYNCTECEFKSKQKNDLKRHVDTVHNGEKHFSAVNVVSKQERKVT